MKQHNIQSVRSAIKNQSKEQTALLDAVKKLSEDWKAKADDLGKSVKAYIDTHSNPRLGFRILTSETGLDIALLKRLYACAKGEIIPEVAVSGKVAETVKEWPLDTQRHYFEHGHPFTVWSENGSNEKAKRRSIRYTDSEFTARVASRVLGQHGPNSKDIQLRLLRMQKPNTNPLYYIDGDSVVFKPSRFNREDLALVLLELRKAEGSPGESRGERKLLDFYIAERERSSGCKKPSGARKSASSLK